MISQVRVAFLCLLPLSLFLGACASSDSGGYAGTSQTAPYTEPPPMAPSTPGTTTTVSNEPAPTSSGMPTNNAPRRSVTNEPKPWDTSSASPSSPKVNYPTGIAIPGKPGRVKSPYAQYAGEVDVSGIPSGTTVKCPFTGKIFIVP
jgi:hypothetical protein